MASRYRQGGRARVKPRIEREIYLELRNQGCGSVAFANSRSPAKALMAFPGNGIANSAAPFPSKRLIESQK
jgi:hypothetical protein